ncbi:bifunctional glutamate N-acetyltransferase/amino-acid acetyltransferase ArgJ [Natronosporangium hydrolyticum]|uniref:Arginine biosynthesis bifunctional protein ArgJ n=1 Tax=Natronosporangium hydrolyticum TaxID=2811111 RepID=A0A895YEB8_9ACTN|nr:bifunctional glutamate N-acetyltransferase/amino-acid acetyltransferase ArgJ [Natronosporangium hydrolyticum]QSB12570.1 bifunctional glutamate N-acetyltransferase/amino-acid acetyltransferase ArgJ [Natronosporangium hydrolyticum]
MTSGVTAPRGFRAAGVAAGLKSGGGRDVALVVNDGPESAAAGVFTRNRVKAAPVRWSEQVLRGGSVRAVVLNSGGANACTGPAGFQDTHATAEHTATQLAVFGAGEVGAGEVAVCSTGLIGQRLPLGRLVAGVTEAAAQLATTGAAAAAEAIMTTDTCPKQVAVAVSGDQSRLVEPAISAGPADFTVGGMAKGAGMLAPDLATMLCVLTTDALADPAELTAALRAAVEVSFERLDSDGCLSTNDTVLLLASGASGVRPAPAQLTSAVTTACQDLVRQLLADAEGATKQIGITVSQAASEAEAVTVARAVARSNLVKTAVFGNDPNWGRILAAVGTTDAAFDPDALDVAVNGVWVCRAGAAAAERSTVDLGGPEVSIEIALHAGAAAATVWTNDLTHGYVHENSAYSS